MDAFNNGPLAVVNRVPGLRQLILLAGLALAITAGVTAAFYVREPSYTLLFSNVSQQESAEIMNALAGSEITQRVDRAKEPVADASVSSTPKAPAPAESEAIEPLSKVAK